jgi:hypothetical protein
MEHVFRKEMLSCDFDNEDALYALLGLFPRARADDEESLEFRIEVTLKDLEVEHYDGKGWATDGCSKGYAIQGHDAMIEAIFNGKRHCLHDILTKQEKASLIEDAEDSAIKALEEKDKEIW